MARITNFNQLLQIARQKDIAGIAINSAKVISNGIFIAIKGFKTDGHIFVPQALENGAAYVVVERDLGLENQVLVEDSRIALAKLSHAFYGNPSEKLELIGITGTNGKTSTAFMLYHVLEKEGAGLLSTVETIVDKKRLPQDRTTPEAPEIDRLLLEMYSKEAQYAIMEVSSHSIALNRVYSLRFSGGIFTNLTQDHLDFHKTMGLYAEAKQDLFTKMPKESVAVFNADDPYSSLMAQKYRGKKLTFGVKSGDITAEDIKTTATSISYTLKAEKTQLPLKMEVGGDFNVYNSLGVLALLYGMGFNLSVAVKRLETFQGVPGRFEKVDFGQDFTVIVDYAHTPDGLESVLLSARKQLSPGAKLIVVFGCGGDRDRGKRPKMGIKASFWADRIIITSDNPRSEDPAKIIEDIKKGIKSGSYITCIDRREAISLALTEARSGDIVLIAGKGHEDYQEINGVKFPFDDRKVAMKGLIRLGRDKNQPT